jgi:NAD(P)-dependent dehydrogenase (short-subunit alcohol dehydrogenase family)
MRAMKSGVIANIGSLGGYASNAGSGYYCATKFALAGLTEALRAEVGPLGIQATVIEPGYFRTNFLKADVDGKTVAAKTIDDYKPTIDNVKDMLNMYDGKQPGDPAKGAQVIVEALTGTGRAAGKALPARLLLGCDAVPFVASIQERQNREMEEWKELISTTDHAN